MEAQLNVLRAMVQKTYRGFDVTVEWNESDMTAHVTAKREYKSKRKDGLKRPPTIHEHTFRWNDPVWKQLS